MFPVLELGSMSCGSQDSSVGIVTHYGLDGTGIESRLIPVEGRFSAPVQTVPRAHPASYTMGTWSFPVVNWPGRSVDYPPSSAEVKEKVELYLNFPSGLSWPVLVWTLPLPFTFTSMSCFAHYILPSSCSYRHTSVCFCLSAAQYLGHVYTHVCILLHNWLHLTIPCPALQSVLCQCWNLISSGMLPSADW
jgi:hypothetical protein